MLQRLLSDGCVCVEDATGESAGRCHSLSVSEACDVERNVFVSRGVVTLANNSSGVAAE